MKTLTVYTKPGCSYCAQTKEQLKSMEIPFVEIDIVANPDKRDWLVAQGYKTLPVLFAGDNLLVPGGFTALKTMRKDEILARLQ